MAGDLCAQQAVLRALPRTDPNLFEWGYARRYAAWRSLRTVRCPLCVGTDWPQKWGIFPMRAARHGAMVALGTETVKCTLARLAGVSMKAHDGLHPATEIREVGHG